ncbi:Mak10-domain-containing protein [Xylaria intraflava]|nr:Mak10-domain-containing protein [Xylaria intraflava]
MQPFEPPMPGHPSMSHQGIVAIDITDRFTSAVKTLSPGELVKDEDFSLFESVSAIEMMDRKMDSGVLNEGESLDEEYDVTRALLPEEVLGIIDQLLSLEMAWHLGYPLSQTLLTSVYVDALMVPSPQNIDEVDFTRTPPDPSGKPSLLFVLRAYCAGLLKTCCLVNDIIRDELYYEEEDFVTYTYERSLLSQISTLAIQGLLCNAVMDLRAQVQDFPQKICKALESRLELRIAFLDAIDLSVIRNGSSDPPKQPWSQMRTLITDIELQHGLGQPVPEAFSTKLQRRLASTMPPRPMVKLSFKECITYFQRFFDNGAEVIDVLQYKDPQSLLNFILMFQAQKPQPLVFIRTILQNLLFKDMMVLGRFSIRQLLDHDVSLSVLPCGPHFDRSFDDVEIPTDPRHHIASSMELFRQRVADPYLDLLRILCQNRCRVRRTLHHHIQEWDNLEADVGQIEELLKGALHDVSQGAYQGEDPTYLPLSSWVYVYKLRQMEWIVQLGFELNVYQPDELVGLYNLLKRLASLRAQHTEQIKQITAVREEGALRYLKLPKDGVLPPDTANEFKRSKIHLRVTMLDAACTWEFADGLSLLYVALMRLDLVKTPPRPYGSDSLRYELRMRPFAGIAYPPLPSITEYTRQTELLDVPTEEVLRFAEAAIGAARRGLEAYARLDEHESFTVNASAHKRWVKNATDCLRAAIAAGVSISTLKRAYEKMMAEGGNKELLGLKADIPGPGDRYHDWWVVPRLTSTK